MKINKCILVDVMDFSVHHNSVILLIILDGKTSDVLIK